MGINPEELRRRIEGLQRQLWRLGQTEGRLGEPSVG